MRQNEATPNARFPAKLYLYNILALSFQNLSWFQFIFNLTTFR